MNEVKDIPFAIFETEEGQLVGKFKKTSVKKALKLIAYLEEQIEILRKPNKCHRLQYILDKRGIRNGRRKRKI